MISETSYDFDLYVRILEKVLQIGTVDGILFQHGAVGDEIEPSRRLILTVKELSFRYQKPIALCYLTSEEELAMVKKTIDYPIFAEPSDALSALAVSRDHSLGGKLPKGKVPSLRVARSRVRRLFDKLKREQRDPLLPEAFEGLFILRQRHKKYLCLRLQNKKICRKPLR